MGAASAVSTDVSIDMCIDMSIDMCQKRARTCAQTYELTSVKDGQGSVCMHDDRHLPDPCQVCLLKTTAEAHVRIGMFVGM